MITKPWLLKANSAFSEQFLFLQRNSIDCGRALALQFLKASTTPPDWVEAGQSGSCALVFWKANTRP